MFSYPHMGVTNGMYVKWPITIKKVNDIMFSIFVLSRIVRTSSLYKYNFSNIKVKDMVIFMGILRKKFIVT